MQHPKRIETVHVETLEGELCIYDWQLMEVHNLNPTAATVWGLCDGQTSPQKMAQHLKGDLTPAQAEELVWLTLKRLEKAHLLENEVVKPAGRKVYTRREMLVRLGVAAALLPVVNSIVAPGPVEAQSPVPPTSPQTFSFTGATQTFTVPAGVTSVTIQAFGAQGGNEGSGTIPGSPGLGGLVEATITVTPGETLNVDVGGQGGDASGTPGTTGGFGGGGSGGNALGILGAGGGGGGGGASTVSRGGVPLVVAGGGGGVGGSGWIFPEAINGGAGGGSAAPGNGQAGATGSNASDGGGGGGGTSNGPGGTGGTAGFDTTSGMPGTAGTAGSGGNGGDAGGTDGCGGGGGGGGFHGGGGGGGGAAVGSNDGSGGGGGGGASFTAAGATAITHAQGVRSSNGQVVINW